MTFPTAYPKILERIDQIDATAYGSSRNYIDGAVTRLSPYISRGVISTKMVMEHILAQGHPFYKVSKLIQELAWRDYWQQVWISKGDLINQDLKHEQPDVSNHGMPRALATAQTGITAIDKAITAYYDHGYLHNHVRMYIAAMACNIGKSHWKIPARWMYYHLLDGDWASNALSWQWVAGANANKKYYANQENINRYCHTDQSGTFMDVPYEDFTDMKIPDELHETLEPQLSTPLPIKSAIKLNSQLPTLIYNYYNLDPNWRSNERTNRILLLEPSVFDSYPISENSMGFMMGLAKNIDDIQVFVGEFDELIKLTGSGKIIYKEHPLNTHYKGTEDTRDWMFSVKGYFPSFFAFWKKCQKEISYK